MPISSRVGLLFGDLAVRMPDGPEIHGLFLLHIPVVGRVGAGIRRGRRRTFTGAHEQR